MTDDRESITAKQVLSDARELCVDLGAYLTELVKSLVAELKTFVESEKSNSPD